MLIDHIFNPLSKSPIDYQTNYHFLLVLYAFLFYCYRKGTQKNTKVERKYYEENDEVILESLNDYAETVNASDEETHQFLEQDQHATFSDQMEILAMSHQYAEMDNVTDDQESTSETIDVSDDQESTSETIDVSDDQESASETIDVSDDQESTSEMIDEETFLPVERPSYSDDDDNDDDDDDDKDATKNNEQSAEFQSNFETDVEKEKSSSEEELKQLLFEKESLGQELDLNGANKNRAGTSIALTSEITLETFPGFFVISAFQWQSDRGTHRIVVHYENQFLPLMLGAILHNIVLPICSLLSTRLFFSFLLSLKVVQLPITLLYFYTKSFWLAKNCFILITQIYFYFLYNKEKKTLENCIYFLADRCAKNLIVGFLLSYTIVPYFYDCSILDTIQILLMIDLFF